jgi:hypothetical protein
MGERRYHHETRPLATLMPAKFGFALALVVLATVPSVRAQPPFPVPRAQQELIDMAGFAKGFGQNHRGDATLFQRWVMPFAPLDLQVGKATYDEASSLRGFYLGFVGAMFGVNPAKLASDFHCGPDCTRRRFDELSQNLPKIEKVVDAFKQLKGIDVLASWGRKGEFRVNGLFKVFGQTNVTSPSPVMGFVPSASWTPADPDKYIASLGASPTAVRSLLAAQEALSIAALVRESDGTIRVIRLGIADNEAGLIFPSGKQTAATRGAKLPDGRQIVFVREVKAPVLFYETT